MSKPREIHYFCGKDIEDPIFNEIKRIKAKHGELKRMEFLLGHNDTFLPDCCKEVKKKLEKHV